MADKNVKMASIVGGRVEWTLRQEPVWELRRRRLYQANKSLSAFVGVGSRRCFCEATGLYVALIRGLNNQREGLGL